MALNSGAMTMLLFVMHSCSKNLVVDRQLLVALQVTGRKPSRVDEQLHDG